jgi:hypothetical protein
LCGIVNTPLLNIEIRVEYPFKDEGLSTAPDGNLPELIKITI